MAERPFVVGLSGIPGSGKTTLLRLLLQDYRSAQAIYYDRLRPEMTNEQIDAWLWRAGDPNELILTDLIGELTRQTQIQPSTQSRPLVFFETAFGRLHDATGAFINFLVWIDTPLDIAMARANLVFLENTQRNPAPNAASDFVKWLTKYMLDYPMLHTMYQALNKRLRPLADLVLDGTKPPEVSAEAVKEALIARGLLP